MTLGQGKVYSFDTGWTLSYPDGRKVQVQSLPYHSVCKAEDILVMEKKIPEQYYGKTMFFLSADKELVIRMDGEEIYSFGKNNKRLFGHTPGSVFNFVDIPEECKEGILEIEMVSSYDNYASYLSNIRVADRDVAILRVLKENMISILCCVILAFCNAAVQILLQVLNVREFMDMAFLSHTLIFVTIIVVLVNYIGVADAYDAMTSNRCYRDALSQDAVRQEIVKGRGKPV